MTQMLQSVRTTGAKKTTNGLMAMKGGLRFYSQAIGLNPMSRLVAMELDLTSRMAIFPTIFIGL